MPPLSAINCLKVNTVADGAWIWIYNTNSKINQCDTNLPRQDCKQESVTCSRRLSLVDTTLARNFNYRPTRSLISSTNTITQPVKYQTPQVFFFLPQNSAFVLRSFPNGIFYPNNGTILCVIFSMPNCRYTSLVSLNTGFYHTHCPAPSWHLLGYFYHSLFLIALVLSLTPLSFCISVTVAFIHSFTHSIKATPMTSAQLPSPFQ
jgi:hypothetical protein